MLEAQTVRKLWVQQPSSIKKPGASAYLWEYVRYFNKLHSLQSPLYSIN